MVFRQAFIERARPTGGKRAARQGADDGGRLWAGGFQDRSVDGKKGSYG